MVMKQEMDAQALLQHMFSCQPTCPATALAPKIREFAASRSGAFVLRPFPFEAVPDGLRDGCSNAVGGFGLRDWPWGRLPHWHSPTDYPQAGPAGPGWGVKGGLVEALTSLCVCVCMWQLRAVCQHLCVSWWCLLLYSTSWCVLAAPCFYFFGRVTDPYLPFGRLLLSAQPF